mgnify:CR=1 FL=1
MLYRVAFTKLEANINNMAVILMSGSIIILTIILFLCMSWLLLREWSFNNIYVLPSQPFIFHSWERDREEEYGDDVY